jgi:hypothetical protein
MKPAPSATHLRGSTLVEAVLAVGVLAVAIPMVFAALAESGKSGLASQAETRCAWMISACMEEIRASRDGRPRFFSATAAGQEFPPAGEVWALAFAADGTLLGKLANYPYQSGTRELNGRNVRYIASLRAFRDPSATPDAPMLRVDISIEHPAIHHAGRRERIDFHTRMP